MWLVLFSSSWIGSIFFFCQLLISCFVVPSLKHVFFVAYWYISSGPVLMDEFVVWYRQKYPPKSSSAWLTLPESSFTTKSILQHAAHGLCKLIMPRKDIHWLGMLLTKNVTLKRHQSHCDFFNSGMNEITKQCIEMARTIHCFNLHALPIALLKKLEKRHIKNIYYSCTWKKGSFDLLHWEVLTERKHLSTPINVSSLRLTY